MSFLPLHRLLFSLCLLATCAATLSAQDAPKDDGAKAKKPAKADSPQKAKTQKAEGESATTEFAKQPKPVTPTVEGVEHFFVQSKLLTRFWGRPIFVEAGVVLPPDYKPDGKTPVCYSIHGFGGSHRSAWRIGKRLRQKMAEDHPKMLYVFLNAACPLGHHEFADSVNNGPWGQALIEEFIPALEKKYGSPGNARGRFLTGHSSGGWSSLWLQVMYPDFFGGVWSTAPDSIDFRDFTGIDVYRFKNAYVDPEGNVVNLVRKSDGSWGPTIKQYAQAEFKKKHYGGQFASFDAVFSPRGEDGQPMKMFDRESGAIDARVLESWKQYDICLQLKKRWKELGPKLAGKLNIYVGTKDTYRLEGAVILAEADLKKLGSDANIVIVEGRNHGNLFAPHKELWPKGLLPHIHRAMQAKWEQNQKSH